MDAAEGLGLQDLGVCLVRLLSVTSCASQVLYLLCDTCFPIPVLVGAE